MNYERCISPDRNVPSNGPEPLVPVYDIVTHALGLANDIGTLTGSIKEKLFGNDPLTPPSGAGIGLPPNCVVDFLEVIIVVLEGTAKRLQEIDNRL